MPTVFTCGRLFSINEANGPPVTPYFVRCFSDEEEEEEFIKPQHKTLLKKTTTIECSVMSAWDLQVKQNQIFCLDKTDVVD